VDEDGFAYNVPSVTVEIFGTVRSPSSSESAVSLTGANNAVDNSGLIVGPGNGIVAPNAVTVENRSLGQISAGTGVAISAALSGRIVNLGLIDSLAGTAIEAGIALDLENVAGRIGSLGSEDTILAGNSATVLNSQAGAITSLNGAALRAGLDLTFSNTAATVSSLGTGSAIVAGEGADITNTTGEILSTVGTAVAVTTNATISNGVGARIASTDGSAVNALTGLDLTNADATIAAQGDGTAVDAGISATIRNQPGGTISALRGTAIVADALLELTNGPRAEISSDLGLAVDAGTGAIVRNVGSIDGGVGGVELGSGSTLDNALGGTIETRSGAAVLGTDSVRIENGSGAVIRNLGAGSAVELRDPDMAELINRGELHSADGSAVVIGAGREALIDNEREGEIRAERGSAIVTRAVRTSIDNAGDILADETAIDQVDGDRLDVINRAGGRIESILGAAVDLRDGRIVNESRARISGERAGLSAEAGRLENGGRIEARDRRDGAGVEVGAGAEDMEIENGGEIVGATGIRFSDGNTGRQSIKNTGRIEGTAGAAILFGAADDGANLQLSGESEIFGDVLFGGSDDALDIFDISSGSLIAGGLFDGGAGTDTLSFAASYAASDFTAFDFLDAWSVGITVTAEDGQSLYGLFRNFETFLIGGTERSYAELRDAFTPAVAPVPVPAALPMMLAALGGLGWAARRRRRRLG
jgi:hypothetical protein